MKPIPIEIIHTVHETDFGERHSWRYPGHPTAHDTEYKIRGFAAETVTALAVAGIAAEIVVTHRRNQFPANW